MHSVLPRICTSPHDPLAVHLPDLIHHNISVIQQTWSSDVMLQPLGFFAVAVKSASQKHLHTACQVHVLSCRDAVHRMTLVTTRMCSCTTKHICARMWQYQFLRLPTFQEQMVRVPFLSTYLSGVFQTMFKICWAVVNASLPSKQSPCCLLFSQ